MARSDAPLLLAIQELYDREEKALREYWTQVRVAEELIRVGNALGVDPTIAGGFCYHESDLRPTGFTGGHVTVAMRKNSSALGIGQFMRGTFLGVRARNAHVVGNYQFYQLIYPQVAAVFCQLRILNLQQKYGTDLVRIANAYGGRDKDGDGIVDSALRLVPQIERFRKFCRQNGLKGVS